VLERCSPESSFPELAHNVFSWNHPWKYFLKRLIPTNLLGISSFSVGTMLSRVLFSRACTQCVFLKSPLEILFETSHSNKPSRDFFSQCWNGKVHYLRGFWERGVQGGAAHKGTNRGQTFLRSPSQKLCWNEESSFSELKKHLLKLFFWNVLFQQTFSGSPPKQIPHSIVFFFDRFRRFCVICDISIEFVLERFRCKTFRANLLLFATFRANSVDTIDFPTIERCPRRCGTATSALFARFPSGLLEESFFWTPHVAHHGKDESIRWTHFSTWDVSSISSTVFAIRPIRCSHSRRIWQRDWKEYAQKVAKTICSTREK